MVSLRSAPFDLVTDSSSPPKYFSSMRLVGLGDGLEQFCCGTQRPAPRVPRDVDDVVLLASFGLAARPWPSLDQVRRRPESPSERIGSWIGMTRAPRRSSIVFTEK